MSNDAARYPIRKGVKLIVPSIGSVAFTGNVPFADVGEKMVLPAGARVLTAEQTAAIDDDDSDENDCGC